MEDEMWSRSNPYFGAECVIEYMHCRSNGRFVNCSAGSPECCFEAAARVCWGGGLGRLADLHLGDRRLGADLRDDRVVHLVAGLGPDRLAELLGAVGEGAEGVQRALVVGEELVEVLACLGDDSLEGGLRVDGVEGVGRLGRLLVHRRQTAEGEAGALAGGDLEVGRQRGAELARRDFRVDAGPHLGEGAAVAIDLAEDVLDVADEVFVVDVGLALGGDLHGLRHEARDLAVGEVAERGDTDRRLLLGVLRLGDLENLRADGLDEGRDGLEGGIVVHGPHVAGDGVEGADGRIGLATATGLAGATIGVAGLAATATPTLAGLSAEDVGDRTGDPGDLVGVERVALHLEKTPNFVLVSSLTLLRLNALAG